MFSEEQIVRICLDYEFDPAKIESYLTQFRTEQKYEGIEAYEWQTTLTRQDKENKRKEQQRAAELKRIEMERRRAREEYQRQKR